MIVKILGSLDILSAIVIWLFMVFNIPILAVVTLVALYLIAKGIGFVIAFRDVASIIDVIAGLIIFASLSISMPAIVGIIISLYLFQKGVFSLI